MKKQTLSDVIFEDIKKRILDGELKLHTKLPAERTLADHYKVSRIPVRGALEKLEQEGITVKTPGSETTIIKLPVPPTPAPDVSASGVSASAFSAAAAPTEAQALLETVQLRRIIEAEAARCAALYTTSEGLERIQQALFETISEIRKLKSGEPNYFYEADQKFHWIIAEESQNPLCIQCLKAMPSILRWQQTWSLNNTTPRDEVISYHTQIFENILNKNSQGAYNAMYSHLARVEELISGTFVQKK